jgi:hypothetical protein
MRSSSLLSLVPLRLLVEGPKLTEGSSVVVLTTDDRGVTLTPEEREFHIEEFKQLKSEVTGILSSINALARYAIVVPAGVFAWLAVQGLGVAPQVAGQPAASPWCLKLPRDLYKIAWHIPAAFAILCGLAALVGIARVVEMGDYIGKLEAQLGRSSLGWESELKHRGELNKRRLPIVTSLGFVFWIAIVASTCCVAHKALALIDKDITVCPAERE